MGEAISFLQYGELGVLAIIIVATIYGLRSIWLYLTAEKGPLERLVATITTFLATITAFVDKQGEVNDRVITAHASQSANIEQLRRAGRHFVCAAIDVANKLQLSEETKRALRHAEEELNS